MLHISDIWWYLYLGGVISDFTTLEYMLNWILFDESLYLAYWLSIAKFYILHYDMRWLSASLSNRWHRIISRQNLKKSQKTTNGNDMNIKSISNPTTKTGGLSIKKYNWNSVEPMWFIDNKSKYGNSRNVLIFCYCIGTVFSIIELPIDYIFTVVYSTHESYLVFLSTVFFLWGIILCIFGFLYFHIKHKLSFEDNFFVGKELSLYFWFIFCVFCIFFTNELFTFIEIGIPQTEQFLVESTEGQIAYFIYSICKTSSLFALWLFQTKWVLNQLGPLLNDSRFILKKHKRSKTKSKTSPNTNKKTNSNHSKKGKKDKGWMNDLETITTPLIELNQLSQYNAISSKTSSTQANGVLRSDNMIDENKFKLSRILSHDRALDLFVQHMAKEFSIECLLSIIEFIQYETYIFDHLRYKSLLRSQHAAAGSGDDSKDSVDNDIDICDNRQIKKIEKNLISNKKSIVLPDSIPKSDIVYDTYWQEYECDDYNYYFMSCSSQSDLFGSRSSMMTNNTNITCDSESNINSNTSTRSSDWKNNAKTKAYKLYFKYIMIGSEYEINIASRKRNKFNSLMSDYRIWMQNDAIKEKDLVFLFQPCVADMLYLLHGSLSRFKNSPHFNKLKSVITF